MKTLLLVSLFLLAAMPTFAQTPATNPRQHVSWNQDVTGTGDTLTEVRQYIYRGYVDGSLTGTVLLNVVCIAGGTAADPFVCSATWPTLPLGPHTISVSAANTTGESLQSTPLAFVFQAVIPNVPKMVRIS